MKLRFNLSALLAFTALSYARKHHHHHHNETESAFEVITLEAVDASIQAQFIPFGATALAVNVLDKDGEYRDILLGYDEPTRYTNDSNYFGPIVGRYANRIRNGTFTIPISKNAEGPNPFEVVKNEHDGVNTLHGGEVGYNERPWTILNRDNHTVTFALFDSDGFQGFPGDVVSAVTYTLEENSVFKMSIRAIASNSTPIMMSGHHLWNLEGYKETQDLDGHIVQFNSSHFIATDGILIPTGELIPVEGTPMDFNEPRSIGEGIPETEGSEVCGTGCIGYDNCWVYDENNSTEPAFSMWSINSGIRMDVTTNQPALQIYSCNGIKGDIPIPRKASQGGPDTFYENFSCLVIEQQSWIDAINNPEFGIDQIYGPDRAYNWEATYAFSIFEDGSG
ncbi:galactose mutarotase-like protein [Pterulicium gracile]|uniref:Galactose mutarotase-like protein n=1 Tax=Pterulicium gracile TaxID=1884261 RepID=A0A5C3R0X5_9AGAR|nr:galactose mutarotase-like protein [Pterula gracilis]